MKYCECWFEKPIWEKGLEKKFDIFTKILIVSRFESNTESMHFSLLAVSFLLQVNVTLNPKMIEYDSGITRSLLRILSWVICQVEISMQVKSIIQVIKKKKNFFHIFPSKLLINLEVLSVLQLIMHRFSARMKQLMSKFKTHFTHWQRWLISYDSIWNTSDANINKLYNKCYGDFRNLKYTFNRQLKTFRAYILVCML